MLGSAHHPTCEADVILVQPRISRLAVKGIGFEKIGIEMLLLFEHLCRRAVIDRLDVEENLAVAITSVLFLQRRVWCEPDFLDRGAENIAERDSVAHYAQL